MQARRPSLQEQSCTAERRRENAEGKRGRTNMQVWGPTLQEENCTAEAQRNAEGKQSQGKI